MGSIVSSITGGITGNRGGAGLGYNADAAPLLNGVTEDQAKEQYANAQTGLQNQASFLAAVQGQNGLGNQSSVYNQLQGIADGTGPNPAQAALAQSTQANVANQAALMAGQRGSSANAGLIARQAAMQGANTQQQAAGQAATMQANQSLNALNQQGALATNMANQQANATNAYTNATQGEQGQVLGAIGAQNQASVGSTGSRNSANAGISGIAAKQQGDLIGNVFQGVGSAFGLAEGGKVPAAMPQMYAEGTPLAPVGGATSTGPKSATGKFFSALGKSSDTTGQSPMGAAGAGSMLGKGIGMGLKAGFNSLFGSKAPGQSQVPTDQENANFYGAPSANGGKGTDFNDAYNEAMGMSNASGLQVPAAQDLAISQAGSNGVMQDATGGGMDFAMEADGGMIQSIVKAAPMIAKFMAAEGGKVPALVSPGEVYLAPEKVKEVQAGKADPIKAGAKVPGKPKVGGAVNSYANDTVPAELEEGGLVIPRAVTQSKNPHWAAMRFVHAHMMANGGRVVLPPKPKGPRK